MKLREKKRNYISIILYDSMTEFSELLMLWCWWQWAQGVAVTEDHPNEHYAYVVQISTKIH